MVARDALIVTASLTAKAMFTHKLLLKKLLILLTKVMIHCIHFRIKEAASL